MTQTPIRTVYLERGAVDDHVVCGETDGDVLIAAIGALRRTVAGRSIRETLHDAGVPFPTHTQTLRVNTDDESNLERIVQPKDKLTIVNRVVGG